MSGMVKGNSLLAVNALAPLTVPAAAVLARQEFAQVQEPRPRRARRVVVSQQLAVLPLPLHHPPPSLRPRHRLQLEVLKL